MNKNLYIENYSCMNRMDDYKKVCSAMVDNGFTIVENIENADYALVFTCGSTEAFIKRSYSAINNIEKHIIDNHIIVCGCSTVTAAKLFSNKHYILCSPTDFDAVKKIFGFEIEANKEIKDVTDDLNSNGRKCIIVQKGCIRKCSYCSIWKAVGDIQSKSIESIRSIVENCILEKQFDLSISGDCIGDYGIDNGSNIIELIHSICDVSEKITLNIYDIHPQTLLRYKNDFISLSNEGKFRLLGIPVQSGSNRILKLMRRDFDMKSIKETLIELKKAGVKLCTDIIIGFPGETDDDFNETIAFLKDIDFDHISINAYTDMDGSDSSKMSNKVSIKDIIKRYAILQRSGVKGINEEFFEFQIAKLIER